MRKRFYIQDSFSVHRRTRVAKSLWRPPALSDGWPVDVARSAAISRLSQSTRPLIEVDRAPLPKGVLICTAIKTSESSTKPESNRRVKTAWWVIRTHTAYGPCTYRYFSHQIPITNRYTDSQRVLSPRPRRRLSSESWLSNASLVSFVFVYNIQLIGARCRMPRRRRSW